MNSALEVVGDPWSLLVVRDIVFSGKHTYGEFMASEERIATSVLADRLATLVETGIVAKVRCPTDGRKDFYSMTDKGLALIPVLIELAKWGMSYDAEVVVNPFWVDKAQADSVGLCQLIHNTVAAGGSVYGGDDSVVEQLQRSMSNTAGS
jgi:DNA-binding HxlR family transcriptional regulator